MNKLLSVKIIGATEIMEGGRLPCISKINKLIEQVPEGVKKIIKEHRILNDTTINLYERDREIKSYREDDDFSIKSEYKFTDTGYEMFTDGKFQQRGTFDDYGRYSKTYLNNGTAGECVYDEENRTIVSGCRSLKINTTNEYIEIREERRFSSDDVNITIYRFNQHGISLDKKYKYLYDEEGRISMRIKNKNIPGIPYNYTYEY